MTPRAVTDALKKMETLACPANRDCSVVLSVVLWLHRLRRRGFLLSQVHSADSLDMASSALLFLLLKITHSEVKRFFLIFSPQKWKIILSLV
jgi:hypothetical protein